MSHPCGGTHSLSPRPVRPHRRRLHWRLLRSEAYAYLLSLILCQQSDVVAPDATRELWLQQIPKTRMALETLSTKTQEIGHRARRCISQLVKLGDCGG